mgnify:CR=1 FL=1
MINESSKTRILLEVPEESQDDMVKQLLMHQLETIEGHIQRILDSESLMTCQGEDMISLARTREAIIEVINYNSTFDEQISNDWGKEEGAIYDRISDHN